MRGKRSKQYRKLMGQYIRGFGFREPYQVIEFVQDTSRFKMDLVERLNQTLHAQVKVLITQCSMRHLYAAQKSAGPEARAAMVQVVDRAKQLERRRCGHHPESFEEPLSAATCLAAVVGPTNRHRYVVATQDLQLRRALREVPGVPLVYVSRSVMIMEPMASGSTALLQRDERAKFRVGLKPAGQPQPRLGKRKHGEEAVALDGRGVEKEGSGADDDDGEAEAEAEAAMESGVHGETVTRTRTLAETRVSAPIAGDGDGDGVKERKKQRRYGPAKGPNPLSIKRPKKRPGQA